MHRHLRLRSDAGSGVREAPGGSSEGAGVPAWVGRAAGGLSGAGAARPRGGRGGPRPQCGDQRHRCHLPCGPPALAYSRPRPGPSKTRWDRGEARSSSLYGCRACGESSSSLRSLSSSPEVPPNPPTPPPATAATRKKGKLLAGEWFRFASAPVGRELRKVELPRSWPPPRAQSDWGRLGGPGPAALDDAQGSPAEGVRRACLQS